MTDINEERFTAADLVRELLLYSEWLDADCELMVDPRKSGDRRTHEQLVQAFISTGRRRRVRRFYSAETGKQVPGV